MHVSFKVSKWHKKRVKKENEWDRKTWFCPQNGDEQFWKEKFHVANGKAQHAPMNGPVFFLSEGVGGRGGRIFWFFSLLLNVFSSCSY